MLRNTVSIDTGSKGQPEAVTNEMERTLCDADDPLAILIAEENADCNCVHPQNRCIDCPLAS